MSCLHNKDMILLFLYISTTVVYYIILDHFTMEQDMPRKTVNVTLFLTIKKKNAHTHFNGCARMLITMTNKHFGMSSRRIANQCQQ